MLFESSALCIDIGEVLPEVVYLTVVYVLSLLYHGSEACNKCP